MAKKRKTQKRRPSVKRYAGKTEREWRDFGADFGKGIDRGSKSFSEGMEKWGEDFGRHMEEHGRKWETVHRKWWYERFGFMGPLLGSIVNIIFLSIGIWILNFINSFVLNVFISMLSSFFFTKIYWFFLASLFFGYCNYLSTRHPKGWWLVSPVVNSLNIVFVIWILASIFNLIGTYTSSIAITSFSNFVLVSLLALLSIFIVIGYIFEIVKKIFYIGHRR